jgi:selenocysteine-specific elongation factor
LSPEQEEISGRLEELFSSGGLAAPTIEELPTDLRERPDIWSLIKRLESIGALQEIAHGIYVENEEIKAAEKRVTEMLSGQTNLGPADFKEALPVTRKRLIPLLNYFDGKGTTVRHENGRDVPERG